MRPDRLARLHTAVDRQAGELVRFLPYTAGAYLAGGPDPSRQPQDLVAEVTDVPKTTRTKSAGANTGKNAELRLASHTVKYSTSALPWPLVAGDRVVLLERAGQQLKVNGVDPFGTARTVVRLEALSPT